MAKKDEPYIKSIRYCIEGREVSFKEAKQHAKLLFEKIYGNIKTTAIDKPA